MSKIEAWFMAAHPDTNRSGPERSADLAERDADEALKRLEQREREGRFGADGPTECEHEERADRAEARLVAVDAEREAQRCRADKAEAAFEGAHAEVERLKAKLTEEVSAWRDEKKRADDEKASADRLHAELGAARSGKVKAESLLKEALGHVAKILGADEKFALAIGDASWRTADLDDSEPEAIAAIQSLRDAESFLTRARQEGFEP